MERAFSEALATEGTEFTGRFSLSPSTRQPLLQPGCVEIGKNVRLCVLGALCGRTFLTSGRSKRPWRSKLGVGVGIGIGLRLVASPDTSVFASWLRLDTSGSNRVSSLSPEREREG